MRRAIAALPAAAVAAGGLLTAQVFRAAHRADLPSFPNQNPSGTFGDSELPPLRIVALGDSSLTAPGVEDLDNTWIRQVSRSLAERFQVDLISLAVGGSKARDVIANQLEDAIRLEPDIAVVSVGANDAIRSPSTERYRTDLGHIIRSLEPAARAVIVVGIGDLGSIPRLPPALRPILTRRSEAFDSIATSLTARSHKAVKVWTRGRASTAFWEDHSLFAGDLFHASDAGHLLLAEEIAPAVRAAMRIAVS